MPNAKTTAADDWMNPLTEGENMNLREIATTFGFTLRRVQGYLDRGAPYVKAGSERFAWVINSAAFSTPVPATAQGDLGRNALRGFGATQWDITLRRQFRFTERFSLQFRGDFFNILNHPNFQPDQLPDLSSIRSIHADAEQLPRQWRPERRPQSSLPDWGAALDPVGTEAAILIELNGCMALASCSDLVRGS